MRVNADCRTSGLAKTKKDCNVLAYLRQQGGSRFRMEPGVSTAPIHALQLIDQNGSFYLIHGNGKCKRVGFALAGQRADKRKAAGAIVASVGEYQSGTPRCLFPAHLWLKIQHYDVASLRNIRNRHITTR